MQLHKMDVLTCKHSKTILSAKDFTIYPPGAESQVILVCLQCGEYCYMVFNK